MEGNIKLGEVTASGGYAIQCEECGKIYDSIYSKTVHTSSVKTLLGTHVNSMAVCPECYEWLKDIRPQTR